MGRPREIQVPKFAVKKQQFYLYDSTQNTRKKNSFWCIVNELFKEYKYQIILSFLSEIFDTEYVSRFPCKIPRRTISVYIY